MHRNTLLFTSLLAVVAALIFGVNLGRRLQNPRNITPSPTSSPLPTPTNTPVSLLPYVNQTCGISLLYPNTMTKVDSATGSAIFVDSSNSNNSVAVTCQVKIPRPPLVSASIEKLSLISSSGASVSAMLYHDANPKDGTPIDKLIFQHATKKIDVFVAGFGPTFQQIISSLTLLP